VPVVHLVRHGQASFGADDYDVLSDLGRTQASAVGAELARRGLSNARPSCGTLRRQRDTAALALPGVQPHVDGRWDEYDHLELLKRYTAPASGPTDGSSQGVQPLLDQALAGWVADGDDGGWPAFAGGAARALASTAAELDRGQAAVVFTSGGVIAAVGAGLLGLGAEGVVALNKVAVNGAITTVIVGPSGTSLLSFNDHAHFAGSARHLMTYR
jgi:broad specificity phosphatase PhoE